MYAGTPLKTGQTTVYATNDDGTYSSTAGLIMSYTDVTTNGITTAVQDDNTGLMWQRCSAGLSGSTCATGSAATKTWANAILYCERLHLCTDGTFQGSQAGEGSCASNGADLYTDWKLPNYKELISIVNLSSLNPAITIASFPAIWSVNFYDGDTSSDGKTYSDDVRCVRQY